METPEPAAEPAPVAAPVVEEAPPTPLVEPPITVAEEAPPTPIAVAEEEPIPPASAPGSEPPESSGSVTEPVPETKAAKAARRKKAHREEPPDLFGAAPVPAEPPIPAPAPEPAIVVPEEPAAAKDAGAELPVAEGLNTADGLMRVAGNRKLYLKLLRQFATEQASAAEQIRDSLVRGQPGVAERLAHTVKGVAGNLGATTVQTAAAAVERAIHSQVDPAEIESLWSELDQSLSALLAELKPHFAPKADPSAPEPPPPVNPAQLRKTMREMLPLLTDCDPGAAECLEASRDIFRSAFSTEAFAEFERHVQAYAFSGALELLKKAARKHTISL